jgi:hypothetical protein
METINPKVFGHHACPDCRGAGKIPVAKIPFTDLFIWTECGSCAGTGHEHMGFERNETRIMFIYPQKMQLCGHREMSFDHESVLPEHNYYDCCKKKR